MTYFSFYTAIVPSRQGISPLIPISVELHVYEARSEVGPTSFQSLSTDRRLRHLFLLNVLNRNMNTN